MKRSTILLGAVLLAGSIAPGVWAADDESRSDIGRYQLFMADLNTSLRASETPERTLFRLDSLTGTVWIARQVQYLDKKTGKQVLQRYWEPFEQYVTEVIPAPPKP